MKTINDLKEGNKPFYIILESDDHVLFERWCLDNNITSNKSSYTYYMLIENDTAYPVIGFIKHLMLNGLKGYKFRDIIYDDVEFIDNVAIIKKPYISNNGTYLPYGLNAIVLPVLDRPADICKLYKGINQDKDWRSPAIYYEGDVFETEELKSHFGTKELNSKDHRVASYSNALKLENLRKKYLEGENLSGFNYWRYDEDGKPMIVGQVETLDSIIVAEKIDPYFFRCLDPRADVYREVYLDKEKTRYALQVCLHSKTFEEKVIKLLNHLNIKEYYILRKGNRYDENTLEYVGKHEYKDVAFHKSFNEDSKDGSLNLYIGSRNQMGHILFMALAMLRSKYPFLKEIGGGSITFKTI